jgi:hypothetical protein
MDGRSGGPAETAGNVEVRPGGRLPAGRANDAAREALRGLRRIRSQGAEVDKKALLDRSLGVAAGVVRHSGSSQS